MASDLESDKADADPGFQARINVIVEKVGGPLRLSQMSGLSRGVILKYQKGESEPSRPRLVALARAAGVRVEWLATGAEPMQPLPPAEQPVHDLPIDEALMARIAEGIEAVYKAENARIYALQLVNAAARMYGDLVAAYASPEERLVGLKGMLQQLRRELRAPGAHSKQVS